MRASWWCPCMAGTAIGAAADGGVKRRQWSLYCSGSFGVGAGESERSSREWERRGDNQRFWLVGTTIGGDSGSNGAWRLQEFCLRKPLEFFRNGPNEFVSWPPFPFDPDQN
ncbi:hypothetical protein V6N11_002154 [Hibiscus sabdariffa]|uniref:Secreted protein n=1 Tax=Hibiscus sabdariffa TaxID=183260 RepID=A0ABR2QUK0_9ROSI